MKEIKLVVMCSEDGGGGHKPRNRSGYQKLGKGKEMDSSSEPPERMSPADTVTSAN